MPSNPKDKLNSKKFRKIMANASYWSKIMQNLTDIEVEATEKEINSIEQIYKTAQSNISKDITYWYNKFAGNNVLSFADAQKLLNKDELEEFHWTVDEYINHGQENIDGAWEKQLINASSKVHIKRMDALNMQLENAIQQLYASNEKHLDGLLMSVYDDAYYRSIYEVKKGMNIGASFNQLDHHVINKAINKPWSIDGQTWSERLWGNRETIINKMKTDFTQGIIRGESLDKLTKKLSDDVEKDRAKTSRLVRTEAAAIQNQASLEAYDELGVDMIQVLVTLDDITCPTCGPLDHLTFKSTEAQSGLNIPPFHPNCRCTTVPYDEDWDTDGTRIARDKDGNTYYVPEDMSYEEWKSKTISQEEYKTSNTENVLEISGIITSSSGIRVGDNSINEAYIKSPAFRRKFTQITNNSKINNIIRQCSESCLIKNKGTDTESLIIIDFDTGELVINKTGEKNDLGVSLTDLEKDKIRKCKNPISIHNHPTNLYPTGSDFVAAGARKYKFGIVVTHDGRVFKYAPGNTPFSVTSFDKMVENNVSKGYNIDEAFTKAIDHFRKEYGVLCEELFPKK